MQENGTELLVRGTSCQSCMRDNKNQHRTTTEGVEAVRAEYERQDKRADDCINCYRSEK